MKSTAAALSEELTKLNIPHKVNPSGFPQLEDDEVEVRDRSDDEEDDVMYVQVTENGYLLNLLKFGHIRNLGFAVAAADCAVLVQKALISYP